MPILKTCCCGCTLKTGTTVQGYIGLVLGVLSLISGPFSISGWKAVLSVILSCFLQITLAALLIRGCNTGKRWFLMPWIILSGLRAISLAIAVIVLSVAANSDDLYDEERAAFIIVAVILVPCIGVEIYCLLVAISHFQELSDAEKGKPNNVLPMRKCISTP